MPKVKLNHASSRALICLICRYKIFRKGRILKDNATLTNVIREKYSVLNNYDPSNMIHPNAICSTCCRAIAKYNNNAGSLPPIKACAYINQDPTIHTRMCSITFACSICKTARQRYKPSIREPCICSICQNMNDTLLSNKNMCTEKPKHTQISTRDLLNIQKHQNSSNNKMIKLAKSLRSICGRNAVEPGFRENLREISKSADKFYSQTNLYLNIGGTVGYAERVVVHCIDIEELITHILDARGYDPYNHLIKIGLDGGGGIFKVVMNIIDTTGLHDSGPYLDTGVRKCIIIAAAEKIKEDYNNINLILSKIRNLDKIKFHICADIKLINIISGLSSCAAKHPCPYCAVDISQFFHGNDDKRTIGNIKHSASAYKQAGSNKKDAQLYNNCINDPIIPGDDTELILDICSPPQLHIMQGIVKHIYDKIYKEWSGVRAWLEFLGIKQKDYHNGAFVGNDCMTMFRNLDKLQQMAPLNIQKYVHILRCLYQVVESCFSSMSLDPEFESYIQKFKEVYMDLGISITPKVHILTEHVPDFCKRHNKSLGLYSEQALESSHYDFLRNCWENQSYKRSLGHKDYAQSLKSAVISYSSKNIL